MASIFYMDYDLGVDSGGIATDTPLGWWSAVFTAGTTAAPVADQVCTNNGQTANLTVVGTLTGGSWALNTAAGTLYFYGKTGAFAAGAITWTGGSATIAADANYNPWKTITAGATAARMAPGDTVRIKRSPPPTSLGISGLWTNNTRTGGGFPAVLTITGTASNGGLIRLTMADTATLTTNDVVQVVGALGTVEANGSWKCTVIDATHIDLQGSVFTNAFSAGGTQTCQQINAKAVVLASVLTLNVTNCGTTTAGARVKRRCGMPSAGRKR